MDILSLTFSELETMLINLGDKKSRAGIIYDYIYKKRVNSFDEMDSLSPLLRKKLTENFKLCLPEVISRKSDETAEKLLFRFPDNNTVEAVIMRHDYNNGLCISTQFGCNMGCKFCESGRQKKIRNLTAGEMVQQVLAAEKASGLKIGHVVLMGIGEPFDNYESSVKFIEILLNQKGLEFAPRHITVSTCGVVPKINDFTLLNNRVNLAVSLHAPDDSTRDRIMPINSKWNTACLMAAVKNYIEKTNKKVTFEYIMLDGENDSHECAYKLAELMKGIKAYVNLIPYNETENIAYKRSSNEKVMEFYRILKENNVMVTVRREFGSSLNAACGQLRGKQKDID